MHSEETKRKIGLNWKGRKHSNESKLKMSLARIGKKYLMLEETKKKIGLGNLGKKRSDEAKLKISLAKKGKLKSEETRRKMSIAHLGKYQSEEKRLKISKAVSLAMTGRINECSLETRKKISLANKGEKSSSWKGGVTSINQLIRHSFEYKLWRKAVYERDNWTCVWCGQRGVRLEADHIQEFSKYPELRFAIDNGRTLCKKCHIRRHNNN